MMLCRGALGAAGDHPGGLWESGGGDLRLSDGGCRGGLRSSPRLGGAGVCWSTDGRWL